ncbi:MAG TPA: 50S ribosomal protein L24 [Myxococcota bacterium]|nr:50S ribosomal protein L24 [Myxococcota bacterium]
MSARIRKGDTVEVLVGRDRGKRGNVLRIDTERERVTIERINLVKKHQKPTATTRQGGIIDKEASIHLSNVALVHKGETTRVRYRVVDGKKLRWSVKHDEAIDG